MDSVDDLVQRLKECNEAYRRGNPLVSDREYDRLVERLREIDSAHPFLHAVEPETFESTQEVRHPSPMLSIEKAYTRENLERFLNRVKKAADEIGISEIIFGATPKLDGLAGRDDGNIFTSRGNGEVGYEISSAFDKGVFPVGGRGLGLGEIVIEQSYFDAHLSDDFEHPRNMVVGIVRSDTLNEFAVKALQRRKIRFVPYSQLPSWQGSAEELMVGFDDITRDLVARTDYPIDGIVISILNQRLKNHMGATAHHYRWQIAFKTKGETALTVVERIKWQVGRTGNITPVLEVQPVALSGATIRRVTGHNAGLVKKSRIGIGAEIEIIRSGEVIPKLERVVRPSNEVVFPDLCPACEVTLQWERDFLRCTNPGCMAQITQRIRHWFKTLGNADWFGIKTIERLVDHGYDSLEKIYALAEEDFVDMGFGPVQSSNLMDAIRISKTKPVEDWRFLAAFGVMDLGTADSRNLLSHTRLSDLMDKTADDIQEVDGFGPITSRSISSGMEAIRDTMVHMIQLGFNLMETSLQEPADNPAHPLSGKRLVFTGKMVRGRREAMQAEARRNGAVVQTSVSGSTDYLVCGEKVGDSKLKKAETLDVKIITEVEYYRMSQSLSGEQQGDLSIIDRNETG